MTMKKHLPILLISILVLASHCFSGDRKRAIELNNQAVRLMRENQNDSALVFLDNAVQADSSYFAAYATKCNLLWVLERDTEALATAQHLLQVKKTSPDACGLEGMAYEHLGRLDKAKASYQRALEHLATDKPDTLTWFVRSSIANLLTFVKGKTEGLQEIQRILTQAGDSLPPAAVEALKMQKNEIQSYEGGGFLEFLSLVPKHRYCIQSTGTPEQVRSFFLDRGVNVQSLVGRAGGYTLEIKDKFRSRAHELGLADCPEQP